MAFATRLCGIAMHQYTMAHYWLLIYNSIYLLPLITDPTPAPSPTGAGNQRSLAKGENNCLQGTLLNTIHSRVKQYIITKLYFHAQAGEIIIKES